MGDREHLKARFDAGRISASMLKIYVKKGAIDAEDYEYITGKKYK